MKVIQLDIAPEEIGHNRRPRGSLGRRRQGDRRAIEQALAGRQWFHPKERRVAR